MRSDFMVENSGSFLGKRTQEMADIASANPLNAMVIHNLNKSHNTQRRRDIKANYKAKLPLDKLQAEHEKKKQQMKELLHKRSALTEKIRDLWSKIGRKKGFSIELDPSLAEISAEHGVSKIQIDEGEDTFMDDQTEVYRKN